jgi:hypothetical protein
MQWNNNMKQNNNAKDHQHWWNNMKWNINVRETTNWKNTNNHRTREEQYQYMVMEWLKKNYKPKPKEKGINYKKQEPQWDLFNAKLLNANSMEKNNEEGDPIARRLFTFGMQTTITKKKSRTLIQLPHSTPPPSSSLDTLSNFTTQKVNSWGQDPS